MRRMYACLFNQRYISRDVLTVFAQEGLIYESCERSRNGLKEYYNAIFVGCDENGIPRHAHKKGVYSDGPSYRLNVAGSDPRCSFHCIGTSDQLYVFEAPIDLLSFITLHPDHWQEHSYLALCGTGEQELFWMLEQYPHLRIVIPCLDHDEAGIEANVELDERLRVKGYPPTGPSSRNTRTGTRTSRQAVDFRRSPRRSIRSSSLHPLSASKSAGCLMVPLMDDSRQKA